MTGFWGGLTAMGVMLILAGIVTTSLGVLLIVIGAVAGVRGK